MRLVRYDGPGRVLRAFGQEIPRGGTGELPAHLAAQLEANPHIRVTVTAKPRTRTAAPPVPEPEAGDGAGQTDDNNNEED